jgi:hypothetical protein
MVSPKAQLYTIVATNGSIICSTLGEAYKQGFGILWDEVDTAATSNDGCTY